MNSEKSTEVLKFRRSMFTFWMWAWMSEMTVHLLQVMIDFDKEGKER